MGTNIILLMECAGRLSPDREEAQHKDCSILIRTRKKAELEVWLTV